MARPLRIQIAGGRYLVTARGNERRPIFRDSFEPGASCATGTVQAVSRAGKLAATDRQWQRRFSDVKDALSKVKR